jgi:AraC-like DNA-binding protein
MSDVEYSDANALILPLRGLFITHFSKNHEVVSGPNVGIIFPTGLSSRMSHPIFAEDDCLSIHFSPECFHDILNNAGIRAPATHSLLLPSAMAARNLLSYRLANHLAGALEVEEAATSLLWNALKHSRDNRLSHRRSAKISRQLQTAEVLLASHPVKDWNLTSLAAALECSPFHLTRTFRERVGVPLHRYQLHARLARALDLLLDTDLDLTTIALDLGFSSHSHFTACFRQLTGLTPRRFREVASSRLADQIRKNLIAPLA